MDAQTPLLTLPLELVLMIMAMLPLDALKTMICTGPDLYHAFKQNEDTIGKMIVRKVIRPELIHEARASVLAAKEPLWKLYDAQRFLEQYFGQHFRASNTFKLSQVKPLIHIAEIVNEFAEQFYQSSLPHRYSQVSTSERIRVERALYRYETYCHLFRGHELLAEKFPHPAGGLSPDIQLRRGYFAHFSPWENEQLGCIYAFLFGITSTGLKFSVSLSFFSPNQY